MLVVMGLVRCLFPARLSASDHVEEPLSPRTPWTRDQLKVSTILIAAIGLWITDELHGIPAGWVGLAAGIACFLPWIGVVPPAKFTGAMDMGPSLLVAGLMAIGAVTVHTGLSQAFTQSLTEAIPVEVTGSFPAYMALAFSNWLVQFLTTNAALPSVMLPQSAELATALGVELPIAVAAHIAGYSNLPLPHLATPTLVALHSSGIAPRKFVLLIAAVAAVTLVLLWPLQYLYLEATGLM
jgi:hypothetical protein